MSQKPSGQPPGLPSISIPWLKYPPAPKPPGIPETGVEQNKADIAESGEMEALMEGLKKLFDKEKVEKGRLELEGKAKDERIKRQEQEIGKLRASMEGQTKQIRAMGERLKETEELLAKRSAKLAEVQTFLSTEDRLSEAEVLGIVRDLNENIFQVAAKLTEEWEQMGPPRATNQKNIDPTSNPRVPALVQLVRNRDPASVTFLLQSCLCSQAVNMTSSWGYYQELTTLDSVYQRLSASEGQAISAGWRSLTHSYVSRPPPHSSSLVEQLANVLNMTGSFSSTQQSIEFVKGAALKGVESIIQLSLRSELAFKVDIISSDLSLLFENPGAVFDGARMSDEFEPDWGPIPGRRDRIAGTTEVGIEKSICGGAGESRRTEILLKPKVVLEKDVVGGGE